MIGIVSPKLPSKQAAETNLGGFIKDTYMR